MRSRHFTIALVLVASMAGGAARADTDTDRLREALRNATAQTRQLSNYYN